MARTKGKQINQLIGQASWILSALALPTTGSTKVVTTQMSGKTSGGSDTVAGVFTTNPNNRIVVRRASDGKALKDASDRGIFARLTEAAGVWTLTFYTQSAGSETAFDWTGHADNGLNFNFRYCESMQLGSSTPSAIVESGEAVDEAFGAGANSHQHIVDNLAVSSNGQTAFSLTQTPKDVNDVMMIVNASPQVNGVGKDFTVAGTAVTWLNRHFTLATDDEVIFDYQY